MRELCENNDLLGIVSQPCAIKLTMLVLMGLISSITLKEMYILQIESCDNLEVKHMFCIKFQTHIIPY